MLPIGRAPHGLLRRLGLRFAAVFATLWIVPFPLDRIPVLGARAEAATSWLWDTTVPLFARHILKVHDVAPSTSHGTSGDTLFDWCLFALWTFTALMSAVLWCVVERRPSSARDAKLDEWLRVALRYRLATVMLVYGLAKVFNTQFGVLKPASLLVTYGESSPQGLLWRFMAASTAYTFFGGALECIGALLLFTRRTTTLGALLLVAVMSNVLMLNLCYDVAVKLDSSLYLGVAIFLAAPDLGRLTRLLVLHRPAPGRTFPPHFRGTLLGWLGHALKLAVVAALLVHQTRSAYFAWSPTHGGRITPRIEGTYEVVSLRVSDDVVPSVGDRVALQRGFFALRHPDGKKTTLSFAMDLEAQRLAGDDGNELRYHGDGHPDLALDGTIDGTTYALTLRRLPQPLIEREFEWVMDHGYYR